MANSPVLVSFIVSNALAVQRSHRFEQRHRPRFESLRLRPFLGGMTAALSARNEQHGARADARHEYRVMTGAGSQPHRRQPMARSALLQQALQSGVTMRGPRPRQEIERRASDVLPGRDGSALLVEIGEELLQ